MVGKDISIMKHQHRRSRKEVEHSTTFAISLKTDHSNFDKGKFYTTCQLFASEYDIIGSAVGQTESHVFMYLRFKKPTAIDMVRSICITSFDHQGSSAVLKMLHSKTRRKTWLQMIYLNDHYLLENLQTQDKFLLPFEVLLPAWLCAHDGGLVPKLDDPFLKRYASCYTYIMAMLNARSIGD